jgi:hypothetical protein
MAAIAPTLARAPMAIPAIAPLDKLEIVLAAAIDEEAGGLLAMFVEEAVCC